MKTKDFIKKNHAMPFRNVIINTVIVLIGIGVYIYLPFINPAWRIDYILYGCIGYEAMILIVSGVAARKRNKKVTATIEKELKTLNDSIDLLSNNEFQPLNTELNIKEMDRIRRSINNTIESFRQRNYSAIDKSITLVNEQYVREGVLTYESFTENLKRLTSRQYLYHSAVVAVQMIGSEKPEYLYELVEECKKVLNPALIGEFDHETIILYISYVTNTSILVSSLRTLMSEYHKVEILRDGSQQLYSCKCGVAIFPFSSEEKLINDAIEALDETTSVGVQDYGIFEPHEDKVLDMQEKNRRSILYLETINKNLERCTTFKELNRQIQEGVKLYCKMMGFDNGGIMIVQDGGRKLIPWFEYSVSPDQSGFKSYDSIQVSRLNEYLNLFDNSSSLFGTNIEALPFSVRSIFYNLQIERYYHFKMLKGPQLKGVIYFNNTEEQPEFTIVDREIMICACNMLHAMVNMYMSQKDVERQELILSTLLKRDDKYIYGINSKTNELTYVSTQLAKVYPNARVGVKCFNIFNSEQNKICDCCPLKAGNGSAYRPKLGEEINISTLAALPSEENEVLILLENNEARRRLDAELYDPLMHMFNDKKLKQDYERELATKGMGYIFFIEIKNFESYIPMYAMEGEKKILTELNRRFEILDFQDEVYRYNKNTLSVILKRLTRKEVLNIVENIFNEMIKPIQGENESFRIEFHASLIPYPGDLFDIEQLTNAIDSTLEESRNVGVNNLYIYGEKGGRKLNREEYLLDIINDAIATHKFEVFLQPILSVNDKKPVSAEALLRLNDPTRGYIPPSEFVPIAARNGLMFEIEQYIIDSIGDLWKQHGYEIFQQIGVSSMAINISSDSITNPYFVEKVSNLLNKHRFPTGFLKFEVSEQIVLEHFDTVRSVMQVLRDKGVVWAIDNYGMSVSSNKTFQNLAIAEIKVDRTCIMDIERSQRSKVALSYIVDFAKESKISLVAEGVETDGQFNILKDMKFDRAQGYLFSKPVPIREYLKYLNFNS